MNLRAYRLPVVPRYPQSDEIPIAHYGIHEISITNSIPERIENTCPYCKAKQTPKYIFSTGEVNLDEWICGSEKCITFYILRLI